MLSIFLYIIDALKDFIVVCEMEDFLIFWEHLFLSQEFWQIEVLDKSKLSHRITAAKLDQLDAEHVKNRLTNLKTGIKTIKVNEEVMDLLHQEYLSNHNNIVDVLNNISNLINKGDQF